MLLSFPGFLLNQVNVMFLTFFYHCLRPNTCLNFTNMCFAQEEHTQARLPDTTTHRKRQGIVHQAFVKIHFESFLFSFNF